jgi:hypothetical protein
MAGARSDGEVRSVSCASISIPRDHRNAKRLMAFLDRSKEPVPNIPRIKRIELHFLRIAAERRNENQWTRAIWTSGSARAATGN